MVHDLGSPVERLRTRDTRNIVKTNKMFLNSFVVRWNTIENIAWMQATDI